MSDESETQKDWFSEALAVQTVRQFERRVFVIMPFTVANERDRGTLDEFYQKALKAPLETEPWEGFGVRVFRSENKLRITDEMIKDLASADYVIADLSGTPPNPNVMYELGVRLSISTAPVILVREIHKDNHGIFDVSTLHTFHYRCKQV